MDWSQVDVARQRIGVLALPVEIARTLYGGSSVVHHYREPALNREVVGKRILTFGKPFAEALREPRLQQQLVHDHLVPVLAVTDVLDTDGQRMDHFVELITPFYSRGSVWDAICRGELSGVADAVTVARAAALGLAELHACGIVHRDMKSPNVFLTSDAFVARVGDFGDAHPIDPSTGFAPGLDSPTPWIAPEQVSDARCFVASDLFGLGVMIVEMLSGGLDLSDFRRDRAHMRLSDGKPALPRRLLTPPPWTPLWLRTLVRQLTAPVQSRRKPASATGVADALMGKRIIDWRPVGGDRWEGAASSDGVMYALSRRHRPRRASWEVRVERNLGAGWRALETTDHTEMTDPVLQERFDRAIALL